MDLALLPSEMLLHIFSYLDSNDLCQLTGQVCSKWQVLSYHPSLWKTNKLDGLRQSQNEIFLVLNNCSLAKSLNFFLIRQWSFTSALSNCKYVRKIELNSCSLTEMCISKLVSALPHIDNVSLGILKLDVDVIRAICQWDSLRTLTISNNRTAMLNGSACLSVMIGKCKYLDYLHLGFKISVDDTSMLNFAQSHGAMLKTLMINMKDLSASGYQFLTYCPNLIDLCMYMPQNMTKNALVNLTDLKVLETLTISSPDFFTAGHYIDLFQRNTFPNLLDLSVISCSNLNDRGLELITLSCPSLKKLFLAGCPKLTDKGIEYVVNNSRNLEHLVLPCLRITGSCFDEITKLTKLIYLDLSGCHRIKQKVLQKLKLQNSNLRLRSDIFPDVRYLLKNLVQ